MPNRMKTCKVTGRPLCLSRGVTIIELLIGLTIMAIALALSVPAMQEVTARADVKVAAENISQAVRLAKNTARSTSQPVTLTIGTAGSGNSITFVSGTTQLPAIKLPDRISVTAQQASFTFDSMGMIVGFTQPTTLVLISTVSTSNAYTVSIVNELGYVTTVKGLVSSGTT